MSTEKKIEAVTTMKARSKPYTSAEPRTNGGGATKVPVSLARVNWLDRPEVKIEDTTKAKK